jgi:8-oxo-dGTP pyrophosphatase MutT (NUDIX family)
MRAIQRFEVSLKAFIVREGRALFVREADTGWWELPGGRIDVGEEWEPHSSILAREMREELGSGMRISFGPEVVTWTRQRPTDGAFLFLVARLGFVAGGEPVLSDEHSELAWLDREASARLRFPPASGYPDAIAALWALVR